MIGNVLTKIFGTKSNRDIKVIMPYVERTLEEYAILQNISDDELREKTHEIKAIIDGKLKAIDGQIAGLHQKIEEDSEMDIHEKEAIFNEIDKLEEERNKQLEEVLLEVLPLAICRGERNRPPV